MKILLNIIFLLAVNSFAANLSAMDQEVQVDVHEARQDIHFDGDATTDEVQESLEPNNVKKSQKRKLQDPLQPDAKRTKIDNNGQTNELPEPQNSGVGSRLTPNTLLVGGVAALTALTALSLNYATGLCLGAANCPEVLSSAQIASTGIAVTAGTGAYMLAGKTVRYTAGTVKRAVVAVKNTAGNIKEYFKD